MTSDKTFGTAKNSVTYTEQMQVCLVAVENGSVHTLLLPNGTRTLPVASVLPEQFHEQALCQECLRTLGYDVEIGDYIGCAQHRAFEFLRQLELRTFHAEYMDRFVRNMLVQFPDH